MLLLFENELPPTGPGAGRRPNINNSNNNNNNNNHNDDDDNNDDDNADDCTSIADDNVVTTVDSNVLDGWASASVQVHPVEKSYYPFGSPSFLMGEDAAMDQKSTAQVVDLRKNPEGYTGYTGPSAEKVWSAVHSTNCFQQPSPHKQLQQQQKQQPTNTILGLDGNIEDTDDNNNGDMYCFLPSEQRLYNRFISGLHSSISLHIAHSYCLEMDPNKVGECRMWGLNDKIAYDRVLKYPDRVENLYVAFSLLLRAVVKAEFAITAAVPTSDPALNESLSYWTESLLPELISLQQKAPNTFNESSFLLDIIDDFKHSKRSELQRRFQQLQDIMQCVGCDRCKLWGTLQTLGVGTALRILFHDDDGDDEAGGNIHLSRQEAVALVNTLERLSSSLVFAHEFRTRRETMIFFGDEKSTSCSSAN